MEEVQRRMKSAVDGLLDELDRKYLRDIQKSMFQCSAKCCDDKKNSRESIEQCVDRCNLPLQNTQRSLERELSQFQDQLSRCAQTCYDKAVQQFGPDPNKYSPAERGLFQDNLEKGVAKCADDHLKLIPTIKARLVKEITK